MQKVAIIIVNWNTGKLLGKCLDSLAKLPNEEIELIDEVIVVDNASIDNSLVAAEVAVVKNLNRPVVRFVKAKRNLGFAAANNVGLKRIKERHGGYIHTLLLNPDTSVRPDALKGLREVLERRASAGVIGAKLLNQDGTIQPSIRNFPAFKNLLLLMFKLGRLADFGQFNYDQEQSVDQVMGAAFLIRDKVLEQVGELDENFWIWFEEVD